VANSVEDLCNQALVEIGYPEIIASIHEGTPAAIAALEVYSQTRDELLDAHDWPFARRTLSLELLKGPPPAGGYNPLQPWSAAIYPMPGFLYEYLYPDDCLNLGAIIPPPGPMFDLAPTAAVWRVDNDNSYTPSKKVILTNVKSALGVYVASITDPGLWEPGFTKAYIEALKPKLALALQQPLDNEKEALTEAVRSEALADRRRG
jgi:hypothetical protein